MFPISRALINAMRTLIFLFLLLLFMKSSGARPEEVKVGGVLDMGSYDGKQSKVAIQLAIEDVNNNHTILNATTLTFQPAETVNNVLVNAGNMLDLFRLNVVSVVAPMTPHVSNFVSFVADSAQVPLIAFAANDASMSMKLSTYSIQMTGSDAVQMKVIASLLHNFYWREIVVVFQNDEMGLSGILALNNALQGTSSRIVQKFAVSQSFNRSSMEEIRTKLNKDKTLSRVFLVHTSYGLAQKIFLHANQLGLVKEKNCAWIVTEWVATSLDVADYRTLNSMQGVIGVRRKIPQTPWLQSISTRWKDRFIRLYPNETHSEKIGIVGAYSYDSIWLIANSIDALSRDNIVTDLEFKSSGKESPDVPVFQGGNTLIQKVSESNFSGISGNISFNKNGFLQIDSYGIINVAHREIRDVGLWSNKEGLTLTMEGIRWPNGSSIPPSGYRTFLVGVPPHVVFAEFVNITDNNKNFSGFCIDMFRRSVGKLPYHLDYEFHLSEDSNENPDYKDLVEQVANKTFDAVVADITILANRSARIDFTQPYTDTGLVIMVPIKKTKSSGWAFLQPFTLNMWLSTAAFVVLTAFFVWLLERDVNAAFTGKAVKIMETSLWFSFSSIVFAHRENIMTSLGKIVLMMWLFVVLILNSSYTASLTSILTVQQLSPTIHDIETLRASNASVGHLFGSFVEAYLTDELKIHKSRLRLLVKPEDYADLLRNGSIGAVVDETPYIHMVMSKHCGEFTIVGQPFYRGGFGFLFTQGSPVVPEMTSAVLNITQNRTELNEIRSKWFGGDSSSSSTICADDNSNTDGEQSYDSGQLSPGSFWGLFVITTAAYCLFMCSYFGVKFYKARKISTRVVSVQSTPSETPLLVIESNLSSPSPLTLPASHSDLNVSHRRRRIARSDMGPQTV